MGECVKKKGGGRVKTLQRGKDIGSRRGGEGEDDVRVKESE